MKKVIAFLMAVFMALPTLGLSAYANNSIEEIAPLLSELGIMQGDTDGNLRPDDYVSRAEFIKMAVASSSFYKTVATSLKVSSFKDVPAEYWAAPYIKVGVDNGLVKGYTDATFRPDNPVTYEEAITVMLKVLGYTDDDFGSSWPYGQIGLADSLSMTENINSGIGQQLTRRQTAALIYNTLDVKMKDSTQKLIIIFDVEMIENVVLVATNREDTSVAAGKIYTTEGTFEIPDDFDYDNIGKCGNLFIKNDDELLAFAPYPQETETFSVTLVSGGDLILDGKLIDLDDNLTVYYKSQKTTYANVISSADKGDTFAIYKNEAGIIDYALLIENNADIDVNTSEMETHIVYSVLDNNIVTYYKNEITALNIPNNTPLYEDSVKSTYAAKKSELEMGDILYVKRNSSNEIDYVTYEQGNVEGPFTLLSKSEMEKYQGSKILRNGIEATVDDLQVYDIIYYIADLNMSLVYSNKITGIYENAQPNQDIPTEITVSGVSYKIEGADAFTKLSSGGNFKFGDTVTLLLGKTNDVADVLAASSISNAIYGYVYETGKKEYTKSDLSKYTSFYIKAVTSDGQINEYVTDKDYSDYKNSVKKITFEDGIAKANTVRTNDNVSGTFDWADKEMGSLLLASDVKILDVSTVDPNDNGTFVTVFPSRLDGVKISSDDVLFVDKNDKNQIVSLILKNVTGDTYSYGIITKAKNNSNDMQVSGSYTYDIGGTTTSFNSSDVAYSVETGQAAKFTFTSSGSIESMQAISTINDRITEISYLSLTAGNKKYPISDKVVVYKKDYNNNYTVIPMSEIIDNKEYTLTAYYDKSASSGGRVRIIVAKE